jgi:hypothetical protein
MEEWRNGGIKEWRKKAAIGGFPSFLHSSIPP